MVLGHCSIKVMTRFNDAAHAVSIHTYYVLRRTTRRVYITYAHKRTEYVDIRINTLCTSETLLALLVFLSLSDVQLVRSW